MSFYRKTHIPNDLISINEKTHLSSMERGPQEYIANNNVIQTLL